jgi:hypothetical protein
MVLVKDVYRAFQGKKAFLRENIPILRLYSAENIGRKITGISSNGPITA